LQGVFTSILCKEICRYPKFRAKLGLWIKCQCADFRAKFECHGGHNTVCEALANGLPLVVVPIKDDQMIVAQQVVEAGAGVRVRFGRVGARDLRDAVLQVMSEPRFREAAGRVQQFFAAAEDSKAAADLL
jgi:UDP:flavonoid glycosyltransferase YjiC (YdhE family)